MEGEIVKRWENFPNDSNRKYKAKYAKTTLKGSENNNQGKEFINEKGQDEENNSDSKKKPEQKNKIENFSKKTEISNSQGSDLAISGIYSIYYLIIKSN